MSVHRAEIIASQLVRAVRGGRSQTAFSRLLGYRSNIVRRWETGECWPTAAAFLSGCARVRPPVKRLYSEFFKRSPEWLDPRNPFAPLQVAAFLRQLRGKTPIGVLAARTGYSRYSIGRWLKGTAQPKLPEFLWVVDQASRRALDLVAGITDPAGVPALAAEWRRLQTAREAAYAFPWSQAVLRALELEGYRNAGAASALAWLADHLGLDAGKVHEGLAILAKSGQIRSSRGKWRVARVESVDTSADPARSRELKVDWTRVALERLAAGGAGHFGYSVFAISRADLRRLRDLQLEYVRAMQSLIAASEPSECVGLYCTQLLDLSSSDNALVPRA